MALQAQTFNGVTLTDFDNLTSAVKSKLGIEISGFHGRASGSTSLGAITIEWDYYEDSKALTLQCLKKPFLLKESYVNGKISALVANALGQS